MFAIAWKEYRQTRLAAGLVVAVLLLMYWTVYFSPWSEYRSGIIVAGLPVVASLIGALAFAEEKRAGTDRFLRALPLGGARRWGGKTVVNLILAVAAVAFLILSVLLIDGYDQKDLMLPQAVPAWGIVGGAALLALWAAALFYSSVFERAVSAMVLSLGTFAAAVAVAGRVGHAFSDSLLPRSSLDVSTAWGVFVPVLVALAAVFLAGSLLFEAKSTPVVSKPRKAAGVVAVLAASMVVSLLVFTPALLAEHGRQRERMLLREARGIYRISGVPQESSLLVSRDDERLLRWDEASGDWRTYDAKDIQVPYFSARSNWAMSPDGGILPLHQFRGKYLSEVAPAIVKGALWGEGRYFHYERSLPRLLDLETGEILVPELPSEVNVETRFLGWRGEPARLYALVDTFRPGVDARYGADRSNLARSEIYLLSREGRLVEVREAAKLAAFRKEKVEVRDERGGIQRTYASLPRVVGDTIAIERRIHRNLQHGSRLSAEDPQGAALVYNFVTGEHRVRSIPRSSRHVSFSPGLDREIIVDGDVPEGWKAHVRMSYFIPQQGSVKFSFDPEEGASAENLPSLVLEEKDAVVPICSFAGDLSAATVRFEFLRDGNLLFALVEETAREASPGFERVVVRTEGAQAYVEDLGPRRVRAVAIDLLEMTRKEIALPAWVTGYLAAPGGDRVFCHSVYTGYDGKGSSRDCAIVSLPGLSIEASYHWPGGDGPWLDRPGLTTAFVGDDVIVTFMGWRDRPLSVWRIGPEAPMLMELPSRESEEVE